MSEGDFEVLPLGTIQELKVLRQFVRDVDNIISLSKPENLQNDLRITVNDLYSWYKYHTEKYPV